MMAAAALDQSSSLWTLVRVSGTVDLVLLTMSIALGITVIGEGPVRGAPRFVVRHLHRDTSLIALALLAAHIIAAVLLVHLDIVPTVVPFASSVRRVYLGLGVLAADLMAVVVVTSAIRHRLRVRRWRFVHLTAYAAWVGAVVHGAAPGTDRAIPWVAAVNICCVAVVLALVTARFARMHQHRPARLLAAGAVSALVLVAFVAWVRTDTTTSSHAAPRSAVHSLTQGEAL
jgi:methionine sulfoxide reductase heme-binding subunit